ncbi:MAG: methylenetetrahydrofolate--tRNA-(uracil(54)-C(5))-methyltransferase (FADH(2)-oxidizing) TrmFO [Clostridia bacterium]|nr:methylenetetrahydrofolate--tRNA-(uracil(54)-C(5))-methyltransferase (FADH(2)-oxidizing) TrmFO [Clostridia bacterium]
MTENKVTVVGAGLAGCEAAWQLAQAGIPVRLIEMKPQKFTPAHKYKGFAELVCSNSLKAERIGSAAGMLKEEMRRLGSVTMLCAERARVSAGGALAVDRTRFSDEVTARIRSHPLITVEEREVADIPEGRVIIATGPLTSDALSKSIGELIGGEYLHFHDAAAPIVSFDSIDMEKAFFASRYGRGAADYINCPMEREEYERFHEELTHAESAPLHEFDGSERDGFKVYEGCMPIEVLAKRGADTMRYGPLKPVGIRHPVTDRKYYAVVQLRAENAGGTMYNIVGFQTNLKFGEQKRVFSMIPGLENAEFLRYGVMHRNTFINSPKLLTEHFNMRTRPELFFAGQMTGVEGYIESAASGILAGLNMARQVKGEAPVCLPAETMLGALSKYISDETVTDFQPMGSNMGILPPLENRIKGKQERYEALAQRGLAALDEAIKGL